MKISAVLFDLDETLHDKTATLTRMADLQFHHFDLGARAVDPAGWRGDYVRLNHRHIPKIEVFEMLTHRHDLPPSLTDSLLAHYDGTCGEQAQPFPGARETLERCQAAGLAIGCVTNGRDHMQRSKLAGLGLTGFFGSIVTSGGFGRKKPDPAIFQHCLQELGAEPSQAAFVGDSFSADMEPALALGMQAIWKSDRTDARVVCASDSLAEIGRRLLSLI